MGGDPYWAAISQAPTGNSQVSFHVIMWNNFMKYTECIGEGVADVEGDVKRGRRTNRH